MTTETVTLDEHDGPTLTDPTGEPIDAGCPEHSGHWLAEVCRINRRAANLPPQACEGTRPECAALHAADTAHHDQIRADLDATRARLNPSGDPQ